MNFKKCLTFLLIAAASILFFWNCNSSEGKIQKEKSKLVRTAKVERKEISLPIRSSGLLSSGEEVKLAFKTGGIIANIFVDEGQTVKKDQMLASLDLSEIKARRTQAVSGYEKAERDFNRVKKLYKDSVATYEQFQNTETVLQVAKSNVKIAEFNLKHSTIPAPNNGKILKRFVEKNELIGPGSPVFIFGSTNKAWVLKVGVTDRDILRLQLGDGAKVSFDPYPNDTFGAHVSEIAAAANPMTGTYEVELQVESKKHTLLSGFVGKVEIIPSKKYLCYLIPVEALIEGNGKKGFVYILNENGNQPIKVPVQICSIIGERLAISSGLENVDEVITEGAAYLTEDSIVQVIQD